jgi:hypothetical protein
LIYQYVPDTTLNKRTCAAASLAREKLPGREK